MFSGFFSKTFFFFLSPGSSGRRPEGIANMVFKDVIQRDQSAPADFSLADQASSGDSTAVIGWGVSVKLLFFALSFLTISASGGSSSTLFMITYEKAVRDTHQAGGHSVDNCFTTSENSLNKIAAHLLNYSTEGISSQLHALIDMPIKHMHGLLTILEKYENETKDYAWLTSRELQFNLWQQHQITRDAPATGGIGIYVNDLHLHLFWDTATGVEEFYIFTPGVGQNSEVGRVDQWDIFHPSRVKEVGDGVLEKNPYHRLYIPNNEIPVLELVRTPNMWPKESFRWPGLQVAESFTGYTLTSLHDRPEGVLNLEVTLSLAEATRFLRVLVEQSRNETGSETRMYTSIAGSWVTQKIKSLGIADAWANWTSADQENILLSVSDGDSTLRSSDTSIPTPLRPFHPLMDVNATDPLIRNIAIGINGKYSDFHYQGTTQLSVNRTDLGRLEDFFVQVKYISDGFGISWWLTSAIDRKYVVGEFVKKQKIRQEEFTLRYKEVETSVKDRNDRAVGIVGGFACCLLLCSVIVTIWVLQPIKYLQKDMLDVSVLNLDHITLMSSNTKLREVRDMQASFYKMVRDLKEYRAYVPNAILQGDKNTVEPPTSKACIVFTDIQGSTRLWELGDSSMNISMEKHNDVIRRAIELHGGYEVKTIGDAFMVAFNKPLAGILFSMKVQLDLPKQNWPADLKLGKGGLRVRIGCQYGTVILEENPLTGRADYRGKTVTTASKLERKALGGSLCVASDLVAYVENDLKDQNIIIRDNGIHEIKGLGSHQTYLLIPAGAPADEGEEVFNVLEPNDALVIQSQSSPEDDSLSEVATHVTIFRPPPSSTSNRITGLTLVSGQATIAICTLRGRYPLRGNLFDDVNLMVSLVGESAVETEGVLGSVMGNNMLISWNTCKVAKLHTTASMRFAARMEKRGARLMTVGIATGIALHGNVGTEKRRFHTMFGLPLGCARALASYATVMGAFCLVGDCTRNQKLREQKDSTFLRWIDSWNLTSEYQAMYIYDLQCRKLISQLADGWDSVKSDEEEIVQKHDAVMKKIFSSEPGALQELKELSRFNLDDPVLANCLKMFEYELAHRTPLSRGYRCEVDFSFTPDTVIAWATSDSTEQMSTRAFPSTEQYTLHTNTNTSTMFTVNITNTTQNTQNTHTQSNTKSLTDPMGLPCSVPDP